MMACLQTPSGKGVKEIQCGRSGYGTVIGSRRTGGTPVFSEARL